MYSLVHDGTKGLSNKVITYYQHHCKKKPKVVVSLVLSCTYWKRKAFLKGSSKNFPGCGEDQLYASDRLKVQVVVIFNDTS